MLSFHHIVQDYKQYPSEQNYICPRIQNPGIWGSPIHGWPFATIPVWTFSLTVTKGHKDPQHGDTGLLVPQWDDNK